MIAAACAGQDPVESLTIGMAEATVPGTGR